MTRFEMKTPQKMNDAFALAEGALVLAIQAVDNALGEALGDDACATDHPEFVTAVMMFAGQIYTRMGAPALH
jgi:hypothetical protein